MGSKLAKNTFVKGAFITTLGIILTKILGVFYVVPFHAIVGDEGGALYSYAYTVYVLFLSIATAGIPLAISKIVSEYEAMGYYNTKKRVFIVGKRLALFIGFICSLLIIAFAPLFAKFIFGDVTSATSIEDVVFVIRVIGFAILLEPLISIYRGYFEGHRYMNVPSYSQVLEQLFRILFIVIGSLIALKVFNASIRTVVSVALLGACFGIIISYIYLFITYKKNRDKFIEKNRKFKEPIITSKIIIKKILLYSIPFIVIDLVRSTYNYVDMFTVVKGLVHYAGYDVLSAEVIYSMLSTWAQKFNHIVYALSTGIIISLIPNITENFIKKKYDLVSKDIVQGISMLMFIVVPMTIGICFLAKPIWMLFYGESQYGSSVLGFYIFVGLFGSFYSLLANILLTLKDYKFLYISLISGLIIKILFNISLVKSFNYFELPAYYGFISATIIGFLVSIIILFIVLGVKFKINFERLVNILIEVLGGSLLMIIVLFIIKAFVPIYSDTRIINLFIICLYGLVGMSVYFGYSYFTGLLNNLFGNIKSKLLNIFMN